MKYFPNNQAKFKADFEVAQNAAQSHYGGDRATNWQSDKAWEFYQTLYDARTTAGQSTARGFLVFGRHVFKKEKLINWYKFLFPSGQLHAHLIGIGSEENENLGTSEDPVCGALLKVGTWNPTINDVWVLAGVHSGQEFHAASPIIARNVLDNDFTLSVTGRELFGLALAGYEEMSLPNGGKGYKAKPNKEHDLSLVDYQAELVELKKPQDALDFFARAKFTVGP